MQLLIKYSHMRERVVLIPVHSEHKTHISCCQRKSILQSCFPIFVHREYTAPNPCFLRKEKLHPGSQNTNRIWYISYQQCPYYIYLVQMWQYQAVIKLILTILLGIPFLSHVSKPHCLLIFTHSLSMCFSHVRFLSSITPSNFSSKGTITHHML